MGVRVTAAHVRRHAAVRQPWHADHHRRARSELEVGVLAPNAVLAQLPPVVAPEADHGLPDERRVVERCDHLPDEEVSPHSIDKCIHCVD